MNTTTKNKINIVGVKELRNNLGKYINKINKGAEFTVIKRSKPVFKISPVDEWGDEGIWETVVDFKKIDLRGVDLLKVLDALKKIDG
ncbi:type II toxin-antitoxin system prevent-host-death family antitoxin [Patescibacteria group bacterium]|nr:type II toxin-antitoxin system prevent-host-death family antitoxin [Patescibacteria group bacterium]MBU4057652.1 type II toxin-antitoxin system prevent-host-death family antitoxin [Patescibacteria group bacterium]MBU4115948.1 type II toxin-antitoxin system prevent-host-death family antitoxin [Patescibacteria group bacterium]